jgi:hypothetical protein
LDKDTFEKRLKRRDLGRAIVIYSIAVALLVISVPYGWSLGKEGNLIDKYFMAVFALAGVGMMNMFFINTILKILKRTYLKSYWIEDQGDVVKLFGAVPLHDMSFVEKDLLANRTGYKIVSNAFDEFGCTMAAVKLR